MRWMDQRQCNGLNSQARAAYSANNEISYSGHHHRRVLRHRSDGNEAHWHKTLPRRINTTLYIVEAMAQQPLFSKQQIQHFYDKIAVLYLEWVESNPSPRLNYTNNLLIGLPPSSRVLELGCGAGVPVTQTLSRHENIAEVVANDISSIQLSLARQRLAVSNTANNVTFIAGDMMALSFPAESLDGVLAFFSLFHLPRAEQPLILSNIYTWLKPGGSVGV